MCHLQHWDLLTGYKRDGEKVVTKEDFVSFFLVCYGVLLPEDQVSARDRMQAIEVPARALPRCRHALGMTRVVVLGDGAWCVLWPCRMVVCCRKIGPPTATAKSHWTTTSSSSPCSSLLVR